MGHRPPLDSSPQKRVAFLGRKKRKSQTAPLTGAESAEPDSGAWIFLSHSHRDLGAVRRIRDALEAQGHNPLLFFLKCLGDDDEVEELIHREIQARQFFVLCDSPNSRASKWVQSEVAIIKGLGDRIYRTIDLTTDWDSQLGTLVELSELATVFLSYSHHDREIAMRIAEALQDRDYRIWADWADLSPAANWAEEIERSIDEAVDSGVVLALLSPTMLQSEYSRHEVAHALRRGSESGHQSRVLPVIVAEPEETRALLAESELGYDPDRIVDFTAGAFEESISALVMSMQAAAMG